MNKRKGLSNEDKNEILDLLNKTTPREVLCEQFNVCNATISNIKKHEEVIRADCLKKIQPISFDQYLDIDCKEITSAPLSDKEIVEMCQEVS